MFEKYKEMSDAEKASVKAIHKALRAETKGRYGNLAWGFVRGFLYRRIERTTRTQVMGDGSVVTHNVPNAGFLTYWIAKAVPGFAEFDEKRWWATKAHPAVTAWLANQEGAIAAPIREKKPYVKTEVA